MIFDIITFFFILIFFLPLSAVPFVVKELEEEKKKSDLFGVYHLAFAKFWVKLLITSKKVFEKEKSDYLLEKEEQKQEELAFERLQSLTNRLGKEVYAVITEKTEFMGIVSSIDYSKDDKNIYLIYSKKPHLVFEEFNKHLIAYSQSIEKVNTDIILTEISKPFLCEWDTKYKGMYLSKLSYKLVNDFRRERVAHAKVDEALNSEVDEVKSVLR